MSRTSAAKDSHWWTMDKDPTTWDYSETSATVRKRGRIHSTGGVRVPSAVVREAITIECGVWWTF